MTTPQDGTRELPRLAPGTRVHQVMFGGLGGHSSVGLSLIAASPHLRHSITFFGTEPPSGALLEAFSQLGAVTTSVQKRPGLDPGSLLAVVRDIAKRSPNAVLMHSTSTGLSVLPYCRAQRIPVLCVDHTPTDAKEKREWLALAVGLAGADGTVFLTPQADSDARARLPLLHRRARTAVIPNGIDVERFAPRERDGGSMRTVSMLSRFAPLRDHKTLVSAVAQVVAQEPSLMSQLRVVLAGHGPTYASVAEHVRRLGLEEVVELPGMLDETAVVRLLRHSSLYVHSSLAETMSTAVMQAMSVGLPTIATRIPGMDFLIEHDVSGLLVQPGDEAEMARAMRSLLMDETRALRLGHAARAVATSRFSAVTMVQGYERLIREVMGGTR